MCSVKLEGRLDVVIKSYSESGAIAAETCACFYPSVCNISQKRFVLDDADGAHYRKQPLCQQPKAGGKIPKAVDIGLRRRLPSAYQPVGVARKVVGVSKSVG